MNTNLKQDRTRNVRNYRRFCTDHFVRFFLKYKKGHYSVKTVNKFGASCGSVFDIKCVLSFGCIANSIKTSNSRNKTNSKVPKMAFLVSENFAIVISVWNTSFNDHRSCYAKLARKHLVY